MDEHEFKAKLTDHISILSSSFKISEDEIAKAIEKLHGSRQDMIGKFLTELNIPLSVESVMLVNSILKSERDKDEDFISKFLKFFNF